MPSMIVGGGGVELTYSVGTGATTPADQYVAWATALGVSTTATLQALDDDDKGFLATLAASYFSGGSTSFCFSSEAAVGLYLATPGTTTSAQYTVANVSRMYGLTSRPTLLFTFHPQSDLRSEGVKLQRSGTTTILYATFRTYNAQTYRYQAALRITPQSIEFVGYAQDNSTTLYLSEFVETTSGTPIQQVNIGTSAVGVITTATITATSVPPDGWLSDTKVLREPSILGSQDPHGNVSDTTVLREPSVAAAVQIDGLLSDTHALGQPSMTGRSQTGLLAASHVLSTNVAGLGYHDFTSYLDSHAYSHWVMDLVTPGGLVRVPISSWQATLQTDEQCYTQCVVPACAQWVESIGDATEFVITRIAFLPDGFEVAAEMARAPVQSVSYDRGAHNYTATISGYTDAYDADADPDTLYDRELSGLRTLSVSSTGLKRARCSIDWLLRPAQRAYANGDPLIVAYINYYVQLGDSYMDVGERA